MRTLTGTGTYRVDRRVSPVDLIVLEPEDAAAPCISLHGFRGDALPERLGAPVIGTLSSGGRLYRLTSAGMRLEFHARSVVAHEPCAAALAPLTQPFALKPGERLVVTLLLRLLRFRFGGALLAALLARRA